METEVAVVETPEVEAPSEAPVQIPTPEAEPKAEEPLTEPSPDEVPAETEKTVEEQPAPVSWESTHETIKDDPDFQEFVAKSDRKSRREGVLSVSNRATEIINASSQAWGAITSLNETLQEMQESGVVKVKDLTAAIQANPGLNDLFGFTNEQRGSKLYEGSISGLATGILALSRSKHVDAEAAQQAAVQFTRDAVEGKIPELRPDAEGKVGIDSLVAVISDYTGPLFDSIAANARAPLEKKLAERDAEIEAFKAGRTESPSTVSTAAGGDRSAADILSKANQGKIPRGEVLDRAKSDPELAKWIS